MTTRLTEDPRAVDLERSRRDFQIVLREHGKRPPVDGQKRMARTAELRRITSCLTECQKLDDLCTAPLPRPVSIRWPIVMRDGGVLRPYKPRRF